MPHLPPAHHETSKHDSPNETNIKEKQNETIPNLNSNLSKSMAHHNHTKELTTWFLSCESAQGMRGSYSEASMARSSGGAHGCALLKVRVAGMVVSVV
jgi:hypothetical protein